MEFVFIMANNQLTPIEQKEIEFYGDELTAVRANDGHIYVAIKHMSESLGLTVAPQTRRIKRDEILVEGYKGITVLVTPGGHQIMGMLRVELIPIWLTGIRVASVKEELRDKLKSYKKEAAAVLWEAFQEGRLTTDPVFSELLQQTDSEAVQAYKLFEGLLKLARNQIILEARIDSHDQTLEDYGRRLETIEADMGQADRHITESQATEISQAIRTIALVLSKASGQNEYGRCWGEFYRKFGVSKYRNLPVSKFDEAMTWLSEWHQSLVGDSPF